MSLTDSVKTCLSKYVDFEGRASRSEYWWFWLAALVLAQIPYVGFIVGLGTFLPSLAAGIRRMHDVGRSGWWILFPIYNLVLLATSGEEEANEYGEVPED